MRNLQREAPSVKTSHWLTWICSSYVFGALQDRQKLLYKEARKEVNSETIVLSKYDRVSVFFV